MNRWISSNPSRKRRFEIRSVWSTKESTCIAGAFFLNSHSILADIGKNYYICIGIEALIADRLWNSLPSVNMQNCITFLNALCETGAAKENGRGFSFGKDLDHSCRHPAAQKGETQGQSTYEAPQGRKSRKNERRNLP